MATIDLTEVKSKTLSLSYGYWNKNFGIGRTKLIIRFAKLSLNKSVLKLSQVKLRLGESDLVNSRNNLANSTDK